MRRLLALLLFFASAAANARVISYAPYTSRAAAPAVQHRLNRHFALIEYPQGIYGNAQLVRYDTEGEEEPRAVFPLFGTTRIDAAAVREDDAQLAMFVQSNQTTGNLSLDGGLSWKSFTLPTSFALMAPWVDVPDAGGAFVRGRFVQLRIGTREMPFVFAAPNGLYGVTARAEVRRLFPMPLILIGASLDGSHFLVRVGTVMMSIGTDGSARFLGQVPSASGVWDGWITPGGGAYAENRDGAAAALYYLDTGVTKLVSNALAFSVPSADYAGAWLIARSTASTKLSFHSPSAGLSTQWDDATAPEVEALYPGRSGKTLLVQVHRPRIALDQSLFKDPALAVWHVGDPPPQGYDELFMAETSAKTFVHVDPDAIENGEPFVFDSGNEKPQPPSGGVAPAPPPSGGGSDVTQEWGVVRASLAQRLVLPGAAHAPGAFGSFWKTDVTFYNPAGQNVNVTLRESSDGGETTLALGPHEIRTVADILQTLFGVTSGGGALFITPESGAAINVTSRTYTQSELGTFGYSANAVDVFASFSPRFPATFAGAVLGANYRTNLVLANVSGRATEATVTAWNGAAMRKDAQYATSAFGQMQVNFLGDALHLPPEQNAALVVQPMRGEVVAGAVAIDNQTNDATYFPPDIAASITRMFAAVGHVDGANGTHFRTDLYVFNNSDVPKTVSLQPTLWDGTPIPYQWFTLQPHEVRVFPDILYTTFKRSGMARMRLWSAGSTTDTAIRATARTYTVDANGGTYGFLMPPLNSFQSGTAGDTLEILGTSLQKQFRTNVGLVDMNRCDNCGVKSRARIDTIDSHGATIDSFESDVPAAGGLQINDLFHARGLPDSGEPVLIRVTVVKGMLGAYGAMIDNGTNDPAYFAANLGAKG